ncbi:MAG TPA: methyltransferase domain-containing protein [Burkholderiaceae bacterium]|nr:methyltransferase domain-containing protein [Burkholderiaceae bacterium]
MAIAPDLDPLAVRRQFARRAATLHRADFILRETERRMLERLEIVRLEPARIVDVGCGLGQGLAALAQRYPNAAVFGCDLAWPVVAQARRVLEPPTRGLLARLRSRAAPPIASVFAADAQALPMPAASTDLVWSNLVFHWFVDPVRAVEEWYRVIRPNGLLSFTSLGVDSCVELRDAGARLMPFPDMHDIGDLLIASGFAEPVMDMERITLTYRDATALLADVRALGGNAQRGRFRGLVGRRERNDWIAAIERARGSDGLLRLTLELIFGHAWCPAQKRLPDGLARINFVTRSKG